MVYNPLIKTLTRYKYACVFDINSGSVSAAFVRNAHGKVREVLVAKSTRILFGENTSATHLAKSLESAVSQIASQIREAIARDPAFNNIDFDVHVYIHAPWSSSSSHHVEKQFDTATLVTKDFLRTFAQQYDHKEIPTGYTEFARHVTSVVLNGYPTAHPYNKQAQSIAITTLTSIMATPVYTVLTEALTAVFPHRTCHIEPFIYEVIQAQYNGEDTNSYTIIDIGDVYTSVKAIRGTTIVNTGSLNFGVQDVLEPLMRDDPHNREYALSLLSMYTHNTFAPAKAKEIETALASVEAALVKAFGDACAVMEHQAKLPSHAYIIASKETATWFENIVERFDFSQFTVTGKALHVDVISPESLRHSIKIRQHAELTTTLALDVLFLSTHI